MNYWNPYLETLPREAYDQIELSYFRKMLAYAKDHSTLYRDKLKGIDPQEIRSFNDLRKIPFRSAQDLIGFLNHPRGSEAMISVGKTMTFIFITSR